MRARRSSALYPQRFLGFLVAHVVLLTASAAADDVGKLGERLGAAMRGERWAKAVELGEQIVAAQSEDATSHYNFACALSRAGEAERAIAALTRSAELGFSFVSTFRDDPDLGPIRAHPGFAEAAAKIEDNHERAFALFKERADASHPLIFGPPEGQRDEPAPLLVLLHGRGGRARPLADRWLQSAVKIGAVVVAPEAFVPLGMGFQWQKIDDAVYRVRHAIEYAARLFPVDQERVVVGGFSQGGYVSLVTSARHPELFAGVIAIGACDGGGVELHRISSEPDLRLYIGAGSEDRIHPECRPMSKRYRESGFDVKYRTYRGYGHVFPPNYEWEFDRALEHVLPARPGD